MNVFERFREAWMVFRGRDHPGNVTQFKGWDSPVSGGGWFGGPSSSDRPDRLRLKPGNERTIVNAAFNRIAIDVAGVEIHHAKVDENETFQDIVHDSLEEIFTVEANIDQSYQAYVIDLVMSMFDEGVVAEVPVDMDEDPATGQVKDIYELRVGRILEWKPQEIQVECYDESTGQRQQIPMRKKECSIIENPFYSVMNEKNSVFQRLTRKLLVLDAVDENYSSDKLNIIFQLPYVVRTEAKKKETENRLAEVENQLQKSKHGIAYVDGTEKIIQLNRPIENNLQAQVEWLTNMFFSQLGLTMEILNGTADEKAMANYMNRIVGTVLEAICAERKRKWLSKEQRDAGESIIYLQDPLKLVPVTSIADIFDKLSRNAIISPNEARGTLGYKPSKDPNSDKLINRNMPMDQVPGEEARARADEEEAEAERMLTHSELGGRVKMKKRAAQ